jgi:hypothetical protein
MNPLISMRQPQMETPDEGAKTNRSNEIRAGLQFFTEAIQMAAITFSRASIRIALAGVIKLISDLYPNEPSFPLPLSQLLYDLDDLEHGKVAALLKPSKVSNRPRAALSEDLFRATVAAAMTLLIAGTKLKRIEAARDMARRLSKMGCKHPSGKAFAPAEIARWREKAMRERPAENMGAARYQRTLKLAGGKAPLEAVDLILSSLTDLPSANFPN